VLTIDEGLWGVGGLISKNGGKCGFEKEEKPIKEVVGGQQPNPWS